MPENEERLFIALYTDADIYGKLAGKLREKGLDAVSAHEEKNAGLNDEQQLEYAASKGRAILTHNSKHFEPLYQKWWEAGKHHSGIIISKKIGLGELLRRVLRLLNRITADEMEDNFVNLSEFAERRSRQ